MRYRTIIMIGWWLAITWGLVLYAQGRPAFTLALGPVTTTETERTECYFQIGHDAMLAFHPKSTSCQVVAQELLGKSIKLQAVIE